MRRILSALITTTVLSLTFVVSVEAAGLNAGFVQGIWYSKFPFFEGDDVRVYTAIQNRSGFDLTGKVTFYVNDTQMGVSDFSAVDGRFIEVWTDWKAEVGARRVYAKITEAKKSVAGKAPEVVTLDSRAVEESSLTIDLDTDKDGIGNQEDTDDDGDGISDVEEKKIGTNSFKADTDQDGVSDSEEIKAGTDPKSSASIPQKSQVASVIDPISEVLGIDKETVEKGKEKAESVVTALDEQAEKIASSLKKQGEVLGASYEKQAVATVGDERAFETTIKKVLAYILPIVFGVASFLVTEWKWTVSVSALFILYLMFRRRSSDFS